MKYQEICMEQTHSRSKCKRVFKGVLNKVLVSSLILATVLGSSTTAFAFDLDIYVQNKKQRAAIANRSPDIKQ